MLSTVLALTYEFDSVNVVYAAEFTAGFSSGEEEQWISELAPDNGDITVLYGIVNLMDGDQVAVQEEFIRVDGSAGSERFLVNSGTWDYYQECGAEVCVDDEGQQKCTQQCNNTGIREIKSHFWSAKKLEGNNVVKDFTEPINSIILYREFDSDGNPTNISLQFIDGAKNIASETFWSGDLSKGELYEADISTLHDVGQATASAGE